MLYLLDNFMIDAKNRWIRKREQWREEFLDESGVSAFVATILLILIVVLLCAVFWTNINKWFNDMWKTITDKSKTIK